MAKVSKREWTYKGEKKTAWIVRYFDNGGERRQETFEKKKDADTRRLQIENELKRHTHVPTATTKLFKEVAENFLSDCERRHKIKDRMGWNCVMNYRCFIRQHAVKRFGKVKMTDLTAPMIQEWVNEMCLTKPRDTVRNIFGALAALMKFAVRANLVGRNVIVEGGVAIPRLPKSRVVVPSLEDLQMILAEAEKRAPKERQLCTSNRALAVNLALFCGLRRGEVAGLQWENVNWETGMIEVRHSHSYYDGLKGPKTRSGVRDVHAVPRVLRYLREVHEMLGRPTTGFVLRTQRGSPIGAIPLGRYWYLLAKRMGWVKPDGRLRWRFHDFRHAAASLLIAEGVTPVHVKEFMGHSEVSTTLNIYSHLFPGDSRVPAAFTNIAGRFSDGARMPQEATKH